MSYQSIEPASNGQMRTLQKETPICEECGSPNIDVDATAFWDDTEQCFKLSDSFLIEEGFCNECESECDIAWISS